MGNFRQNKVTSTLLTGYIFINANSTRYIGYIGYNLSKNDMYFFNNFVTCVTFVTYEK